MSYTCVSWKKSTWKMVCLRCQFINLFKLTSPHQDYFPTKKEIKHWPRTKRWSKNLRFWDLSVFRVHILYCGTYITSTVQTKFARFLKWSFLVFWLRKHSSTPWHQRKTVYFICTVYMNISCNMTDVAWCERIFSSCYWSENALSHPQLDQRWTVFRGLRFVWQCINAL